jgi:GT2 family glycosyltransferase
MPETIHILLPVHNRREITRRFVECLKAQTHGNYHLILIDDGSTDGTAEMARDSIENLTVLRGSGDWWWAGSLQQGYLWLRAHSETWPNMLLIINDDTEFDANFLARGVDLLVGKERTLLLAHCYDRQNGEFIGSGVEVDWRDMSFREATAPERINCLSTRGLFLRVGDFLETGGFHPRLLPHYLSDYEFTIRAGRKGYQLCTDPSLVLRLDSDATGDHSYDTGSLSGFLKTFSHKSAANPIALAIFIALACPWPWKPFHLAKLCLDTGHDFVMSVLRSIKGWQWI